MIQLPVIVYLLVLSGMAYKDLGERVTYQDGKPLVYPTLQACEVAQLAVIEWDRIEPYGSVRPGSCQPVQREQKP